MSDQMAVWGTCWHIVKDKPRATQTACGRAIPWDATLRERKKVPKMHYICSQCRRAGA